MTAIPTHNRNTRDARAQLLDAALTVVREKGFSATSVDDLCQTAGVTKGAFFHHFRSKEDFGVDVVDYWSQTTDAFFADAAYHDLADPLQRLLGYIDLRTELLHGGVSEFTCLVGTMVQEVYDTSPTIRAACEASIRGHAARLETDIAEAMLRHGVRGDWTAGDLALHIQAVLQGAFILAKATGNVDVARLSVGHLRRYIALLFDQPS